MISTHSRSSHIRNSRQGFSLIEVAIALVIFVIGALAIIRIFPGALSVIGNNGNQQIATNLNRSTLARLKSGSAVPYANFNIKVSSTDGSLSWNTMNGTDHTTDFGNLDSSVIGVPRFNTTLPSPDDINTGANNSALSRYRGIQGEQVKPFELTENNFPVNYVLTQFPISYTKINNGTNDDILLPIISQEYTVQNARIDKQGHITFQGATVTDSMGKIVSLSDPSVTDAVAVAKKQVPAKSMFYVSYRYYNTLGKVWGVNDEAIPVSTTTDIPDITDLGFNLTVNPPLVTRGKRALYDASNPNTTGAVAEFIDVRVKRYLGLGAFGSPTDPMPGAPDYPNIDQVGDARRGLVRVDSLTNAGFTNTPTYIDYIADWSWLLKQDVPSLSPDTVAGTKQIALNAPFIEDQAPVGMYSLLIDIDQTSPLDPKPYAPFRSGFGTSNTAPTTSGKLVIPTDPQQLEDQMRSGKATFIVTDKVDNARVAFQTRDQWVQQLSVAAAAYKPFVGAVTSQPAEPWRDYYLGDDNYLYFRAGEAGKTISVSYSYNDVTDDAAATPLPDKVIVDRPYAIDSQLVTAPSNVVSSGFINAGSQVARIKMQTAKGEDFPATKRGVTINLTSIQSVNGVSVTARTAYVNGTQYAQKIDTTTRGANS